LCSTLQQRSDGFTFKNGRFSDAEQILQAVGNSAGFNGDSAYYVAKVLENRERLEDAQKILAATLEKTPVFYYRGQAEELKKKIDTDLTNRANGIRPAPAQGATPPSVTPSATPPTVPGIVPPAGKAPGSK
jgi:hypothetical protein